MCRRDIFDSGTLRCGRYQQRRCGRLILRAPRNSREDVRARVGAAVEAAALLALQALGHPWSPPALRLSQEQPTLAPLFLGGSYSAAAAAESSLPAVGDRSLEVARRSGADATIAKLAASTGTVDSAATVPLADLAAANAAAVVVRAEAAAARGATVVSVRRPECLSPSTEETLRAWCQRQLERFETVSPDVARSQLLDPLNRALLKRSVVRWRSDRSVLDVKRCYPKRSNAVTVMGELLILAFERYQAGINAPAAFDSYVAPPLLWLDDLPPDHLPTFRTIWTHTFAYGARRGLEYCSDRSGIRFFEAQQSKVSSSLENCSKADGADGADEGGKKTATAPDAAAAREAGAGGKAAGANAAEAASENAIDLPNAIASTVGEDEAAPPDAQILRAFWRRGGGSLLYYLTLLEAGVPPADRAGERLERESRCGARRGSEVCWRGPLDRFCALRIPYADYWCMHIFVTTCKRLARVAMRVRKTGCYSSTEVRAEIEAGAAVPPYLLAVVQALAIELGQLWGAHLRHRSWLRPAAWQDAWSRALDAGGLPDAAFSARERRCLHLAWQVTQITMLDTLLQAELAARREGTAVGSLGPITIEGLLENQGPWSESFEPLLRGESSEALPRSPCSGALPRDERLKALPQGQGPGVSPRGEMSSLRSFLASGVLPQGPGAVPRSEGSGALPRDEDLKALSEGQGSGVWSRGETSLLRSLLASKASPRGESALPRSEARPRSSRLPESLRPNGTPPGGGVFLPRLTEDDDWTRPASENCRGRGGPCVAELTVVEKGGWRSAAPERRRGTAGRLSGAAAPGCSGRGLGATDGSRPPSPQESGKREKLRGKRRSGGSPQIGEPAAPGGGLPGPALWRPYADFPLSPKKAARNRRGAGEWAAAAPARTRSPEQRGPFAAGGGGDGPPAPKVRRTAAGGAGRRAAGRGVQLGTQAEQPQPKVTPPPAQPAVPQPAVPAPAPPLAFPPCYCVSCILWPGPSGRRLPSSGELARSADGLAAAPLLPPPGAEGAVAAVMRRAGH